MLYYKSWAINIKPNERTGTKEKVALVPAAASPGADVVVGVCEVVVGPFVVVVGADKSNTQMSFFNLYMGDCQ